MCIRDRSVNRVVADPARGQRTPALRRRCITRRAMYGQRVMHEAIAWLDIPAQELVSVALCIDVGNRLFQRVEQTQLAPRFGTVAPNFRPVTAGPAVRSFDV